MNKCYLGIIIFLISVSLANPVFAGNREVRERIVYWARIYSVPEFLALELGRIESNFNPLAKNPNSSARGVFQFLTSTWKSFCEGDVFNADDNIKCAMKTLAVPEGIRHWTVDHNTRYKLAEATF